MLISKKILFILFLYLVHAQAHTDPHVHFKRSPKLLVHIGFPMSGRMKAPRGDAAYFSLDGPFPSTSFMSYLDKMSIVVLIPLDKMWPRILSFHPVETLVSDPIDLKT
jgi:hypothetical protein